MIQDNPNEDRIRARGRVIYANPKAGEVVELLEVREFVSVGSVRLGEMTITVINGVPVSITMSPQVL